MKKVGLGIIGLGHVGKIHLRHSLKMSNIDLIAVSDLSQKALNEAKNAGVKKTFTNYEKLLKEPNIDAVIIALPTHLHLECAEKAAEAQKNIFLEKPIARNTEEAEEIIASTRKNSVKLMIGYPLRFNAAFHELKKKTEKGILGDIEIAYATFISSGPFFHRAESHTPIPVPEWWFKKELTGGGALIDLGSHIINLLRWYFGEITDIKSHFRYRFNLDFEDTAICMAKFENGITGIITVGWFMQGHQLKVELYGTANHAYAKHPSGNRVITATQMLTTGIYNFYRPHFNELQYFVNCIIKDKATIPSGEDGLKDLEAIEKAYKNQITMP